MKRLNENEGGMSDRIGAADTPASPVSALVFKRRHRLQAVLRGPGENEFAVDLRQLAHWYRDIVLADAQEASGPDNGVRDRLVGGDDDVVDRSDPPVLVVESGLAEHLSGCTPAWPDLPQLPP